mmetsp:Transcript_3788/g.6469  ORF Transcript_3788/g.6469 Transcript_3788/m.6469 type:complete len:107 (+) Transcript_3788:78-398(+)
MTFKCVDGGRLNPNLKKHSFEVFGYDFMIDEDMKPWLIEVNTNPCLEETSALLKQYLPRMIDDAFRLTLDVVYPPPFSNSGNRKKFGIDGYDDDENLWRHVFTLKP